MRVEARTERIERGKNSMDSDKNRSDSIYRKKQEL